MLQRYSITLILACSMRLVPKSEIRYSTVRPRVRTMDGCINRTGTVPVQLRSRWEHESPALIYWCPGPGSTTSPGAKLDARQCARRVRAMDGLHQPHGHRAGSTQVTMGAQTPTSIIGARGRGRTGTVSPPRDFHTRYSFHCCVAVQTHLGSGLSLYPILCSGRRQEPSSLYTFPMR
jgi:hypothetical protein